MNIQPIVLAAGKGTRMGNPDLPKVLTLLEGRPLISYLLDTLKDCFPLLPALVVGFRQDLVRKELGESYIYVEQYELKGTGSAVKACAEQLAGTADAYLVLYGDMPLYSPQTLRRLAEEHAASNAILTLATLRTDQDSFANFGRILRTESGEITAIREQRDCTPEEAAIQEYNPGLYCFSDAWLWDALGGITTDNAQGEYYLTDLLGIAVAEGRRVASVEVGSWQEVLGVNTPKQLLEVQKYLGST